MASKIEAKVRIATPELIKKTAIEIKNYLFRKAEYYRSKYEKYEERLISGVASKQRRKEYEYLAAEYREKLSRVERYMEIDYEDVIKQYLLYGESMIDEYPYFVRTAIKKYTRSNIKAIKSLIEIYEDSIEIVQRASVVEILTKENIDNIAMYSYTEYKGFSDYILCITLLLLGAFLGAIFIYGYIYGEDITLMETIMVLATICLPMLGISAFGITYIKRTRFIVVTTSNEIIVIQTKTLEQAEELYYQLTKLRA